MAAFMHLLLHHRQQTRSFLVLGADAQVSEFDLWSYTCSTESWMSCDLCQLNHCGYVSSIYVANIFSFLDRSIFDKYIYGVSLPPT